MKKIYFLATLCVLATVSFAQTESSKKDTAYNPAYNDTIRIVAF